MSSALKALSLAPLLLVLQPKVADPLPPTLELSKVIRLSGSVNHEPSLRVVCIVCVCVCVCMYVCVCLCVYVCVCVWWGGVG